jgi:NAD(P) transhydrogenase
MSTARHDLIVIGLGPPAEKGAAHDAYFGKRVALIERAPTLGGAVANTSIPFKALRETAPPFRRRSFMGNYRPRGVGSDKVSRHLLRGGNR